MVETSAANMTALNPRDTKIGSITSSMKTYGVVIVASFVWLAGARIASAQTNAVADSSQTGAMTKTLSEKPFFGTKSVVTLGGDYVNSPKEDKEMIGVWTSPLTLDQMDGAIAEIGFGEAKKQGEWQLRYRQKLFSMDPSYQAINAGARNLVLSDSRRQVLKASYNLREWWQVGIAALGEEKFGPDNSVDTIPLGFRNGETFGIQIDATFRF